MRSLDDLDSYSFIVGNLIDRPTLERASLIATNWGVNPHDVLITLNWISPESYVAELAATLGVGHAFAGQIHKEARAIDATTVKPSQVAAQVIQSKSFPSPIYLTSPLRPQIGLTQWQRKQLLSEAVNGLRNERPFASAARRTPVWQWLLLSVFGGLIAGAAIIDRELAVFFISFLAAIPFAFVVAQRFILFTLFWMKPVPRYSTTEGTKTMLATPADLPIYSVLVPLFREEDVLPDLVGALVAIDYPAAKLDVFLILEEGDIATRKVASRLELPGFIKVVVVPDGLPRTKPKALDYAMSFTRGEFIVIYDAEDVPDPDQLRKALMLFEAHPDVDCLQAQLNVHNRSENWLTRQFTLEYTALFDALLPALERTNVPLPLGGSSNHFRRHALLTSGLWDPFNVTEDADLGLRLTRQGYKTAVLNSTTWEEAPSELSNWIPQRTRWFKGWMQTYAVHMRNPASLAADLGVPAFLGFQCLMAGFLLCVLLHPWFYVMLVAELLSPSPFQSGPTPTEKFFWILALFNLAVGMVTAISTSALAVSRRGWSGLISNLLLTPFYWLLISLAAYRALFQLIKAPYHWEKTRHKARGFDRVS